MILLLSPIQVVTPKISVWIVFEPQATSVLRFSDTLLPVVISINVTNIGAKDFAGGNLTCLIEPPSEKYTQTLFDMIPRLQPGESAVRHFTVRLQEPGVYTVKVLWLDTVEYGRMTYSDIYGPGFAAQNFQGPEIVFYILLSVVGVIVAIVLARKKR
jgi:hypothetical protein